MITVTSGEGIGIGNCYNLTLDASDLRVDGAGSSSRINGVENEATNPSAGVQSYLSLKNGSLVNMRFMRLGML